MYTGRQTVKLTIYLSLILILRIHGAFAPLFHELLLYDANTLILYP
jgi:hypothetical protein